MTFSVVSLPTYSAFLLLSRLLVKHRRVAIGQRAYTRFSYLLSVDNRLLNLERVGKVHLLIPYQQLRKSNSRDNVQNTNPVVPGE